MTLPRKIEKSVDQREVDRILDAQVEALRVRADTLIKKEPFASGLKIISRHIVDTSSSSYRTIRLQIGVVCRRKIKLDEVPNTQEQFTAIRFSELVFESLPDTFDVLGGGFTSWNYCRSAKLARGVPFIDNPNPETREKDPYDIGAENAVLYRLIKLKLNEHRQRGGSLSFAYTEDIPEMVKLVGVTEVQFKAFMKQHRKFVKEYH